MIVKIKTRKKSTFKQLLNYMLKGRDLSGFVLKHNIRGNSVDEWVKQFKENETYRKIKRSDSVLLSHEILSWHREDAKNISAEKLEAMAKKYINLRNPNALYIAVPHTDKKHFHIHLCASGVEFRTGKSLRMSKSDFTLLKQNIQNFQREKFPELENSIVEHGKSGKDFALSDKEWQIKNSGRATDKEKVIAILKNCYHKAISQDDFFEMVKESGLKIYERGGRISGVILNGRKFRLKRVGFIPERLDMAREQSEGLGKVRVIKEKNVGRNF